jgi:hypothetical protein
MANCVAVLRVVGATSGLVAALTGCVLAGGALAGCAAPSPPPEEADPGLSSSVPAPDDPIPPVRNPRNLVAILPCLLLTPAQLDANRIDQPGRPKDLLGNSGCEWDDKARTRQFSVFVDLGSDVLRNVYSQRDAIPVFELTQVAGLPAIRTKDDVNGPTCYFRVATAPRQTLILRFTWLQRGSGDPCGPARTLTEAIIGNLPPLPS